MFFVLLMENHNREEVFMPIGGHDDNARFHAGEMVVANHLEASFKDLAARSDFWHGDVVSLAKVWVDLHDPKYFYRAPRKRLKKEFGSSFMLVVEGAEDAEKRSWVYLDWGDVEHDVVTADNVAFLVRQITLQTTSVDQVLRVGVKESFRFYYRKGTTPISPIEIGLVSPIMSIVLTPAMPLWQKEQAKRERNIPVRPLPRRLEERREFRERRERA
jgi:hypothetical protein